MIGMILGALADFIQGNMDVLKRNQFKVFLAKIEMLRSAVRIRWMSIAARFEYTFRKSGMLYRFVDTEAPLTMF